MRSILPLEMYHLYSLYFLHCSSPPRHLHSFPTRRSSDLCVRPRVEDFGESQPHHRSEAFVFPDGARAGRKYKSLGTVVDRKSTRLNSSHITISYAVFCLKKKKKIHTTMNISTLYFHPTIR